MSLLVSRRFEFVGFPVGCAEAGWLLEASFMVFLLMAVTLDTDIINMGFQYLCFGRPGASSSAAWGAICLGTPWGNMGAAGRTHSVRNQF